MIFLLDRAGQGHWSNNVEKAQTLKSDKPTSIPKFSRF